MSTATVQTTTCQSDGTYTPLASTCVRKYMCFSSQQYVCKCLSISLNHSLMVENAFLSKQYFVSVHTTLIINVPIDSLMD